MAFTIGSGTFTNGSATVTGVTLTSGTLAYFASGTRMVVGVNPVIQEVEAIAAPTVSTITLRSAWTGTGGTYSFLANQTSEGLRDAVQAIRTNNASLQSFIDSIDTAATANSVAQRTSDGSLNATGLNASSLVLTPVAINTVSSNGFLYHKAPAGYSVNIQVDNKNIAQFSSGGDVSFYDPAGTTAGFVWDSSSGNVGIGTSSPNEKIEVVGKIRSKRTDANQHIQFYAAGGEGYIEGTNLDSAINQPIVFRSGNNAAATERMRIDSSGNLLVGTTSANGKITVNASSGNLLFLQTTSNNAGYVYESSDSGASFAAYFVKAGTEAGKITVSPNTTNYGTSSDYRLKEDWQPMDCACDRVMQLNPVNFAWKSSGQRVDGFLAHELQEVVPEAVTGEKDETRIEEYEVEPAVYEDVVIPAEYDEDGNEISPERTEQRLVSEAVMGEREVPVYQGIDQSKIVPLLTASLQEALRTIKAQGESIAALEARIEALEG